MSCAEPVSRSLMLAAAAGPPVPSSQGTYALYNLPDGGLHLAYRPQGETVDQHIDVPAFVVKMARNLAEGGPGALPFPLSMPFADKRKKRAGKSKDAEF